MSSRKHPADKFGFDDIFMRVKLGDVCSRGSSSLKQSDVIDKSGDYPIYGASGYIGNVDFYHQDRKYAAVVKDDAGIGRTVLLPASSSSPNSMSLSKTDFHKQADCLLLPVIIHHHRQ